MESIISNLVVRFEKGALSRRELVEGLTMLAASATTASAQEDLNFRTATIHLEQFARSSHRSAHKNAPTISRTQAMLQYERNPL
jgi:hypothetical protein